MNAKPTVTEVLRDVQAAPTLDEAALLLQSSGVQEDVRRWLEVRDLAFQARAMNPIPPAP